MIKQILRLTNPGVFLPHFAVESPDPTHILVRPEYLSICAADQRYFRGLRPEKVLRHKLPMALIHEAVGEVLYSRHDDFVRGDKLVLVPFLHSEGATDANYAEDSHFCSSNIDGFTQEFLTLSRQQVVKIKTEDFSRLFVFCELLSVCCHAVKRFKNLVGNEPKRLVGIWGDGTLSYMLALALKLYLPLCKIAIFGKHDTKLQFFTFADELVNVLQPHSKLRVSHAFECVGGIGMQTALSDILFRMYPRGIINLLGVQEEPFPVHTRIILEKGLTILGSSRSTYNDFLDAAAFLNCEDVQNRLEPLVSQEVTVANAEDLVNAFKTDQQTLFKTIIHWQL